MLTDMEDQDVSVLSFQSTAQPMLTNSSFGTTRKDLIFANQKNGSFMNEKIVDHDNAVNHKMDVIGKLIGNYQDGDQLKDQFLKMTLVNKLDTNG